MLSDRILSFNCVYVPIYVGKLRLRCEVKILQCLAKDLR